MNLQKDTVVRVALDLETTEYNQYVIDTFHNKIGTIILVSPGVTPPETLYTVELSNGQRCDFLDSDLVARP